MDGSTMKLLTTASSPIGYGDTDKTRAQAVVQAGDAVALNHLEGGSSRALRRQKQPGLARGSGNAAHVGVSRTHLFLGLGLDLGASAQVDERVGYLREEATKISFGVKRP
jgi:hypothetical protein